MNLTLIAIVVTVLWLVSLGLYLHSSRQQRKLQTDIETLQKKLDQAGLDEPS
jgi:uncharacterized membrane-anchored protein YhcB (DUF1043 family)